MRTEASVAAVGWDSHRKFSQVTVRDVEGRIVQRGRIDHDDRARLRRALAKWPAQTPVILEATFGWSWLADELAAAGHRPRLASSAKLAAWRKARGLAKSNRLDADLLSELPFEKNTWWNVWLPPVEVREARELLRHRMALVHFQTILKNRLAAALHRAGILHNFADLFGAAGRRFLQRLAKDETQLRPAARAALHNELQLLDHVRRHIARATRQFRRQVTADPDAQRLTTLPGVSWILAYTLFAEIGRIERFANGRRLAAYALLAPVADDSGDADASQPKGRRIGWVGRRTLKWAFIEAAHGAVRSDAQFRAVFNRRTDNGRRDRNRGYITVARHLAMVTAAMWKHQQEYSPFPPPRPGARRRRHAPGPPRPSGAPAESVARGGHAPLNVGSPRPAAHSAESSRNGPARPAYGPRGGDAAAGLIVNGPPAPQVKIDRRRRGKKDASPPGGPSRRPL